MMKTIRKTILTGFMILGTLDAAVAQGGADPLTLHGLDQIQVAGARARSLGGVSAGMVSNASALFSNPAGLGLLQRTEVRVGGWASRYRSTQKQEWIPDRIYGEFSLLMENRQTFLVPKVDNVSPNWKRKTTVAQPSLGAAATPLEFAGHRIVVALGAAEVINLDHYFRNNNALDPHIGQLRPAPIPRVTGTDSLLVRWFQHERQRDGSVYSITPAVGIMVTDELSAGISMSFLTGSSDDREYRWDRGLFTLRGDNDFSLEPLAYVAQRTGTSEYRGSFLTVGFLYTSQTFGVGFSARTPFTLEQTLDYETRVDSSGALSATQSNETVKVKFPWLYTAGVSFYPTERWRIGVDYDVRELGLVEVENAVGNSHRPWLSSRMFRVGVEYQALDILWIRAGYRQTANGFGEEGAGLTFQAVDGSAYSIGAGIDLGIVRLDGFYEDANTEFIDRWLSNSNFNRNSSYTFGLELSAQF